VIFVNNVVKGPFDVTGLGKCPVALMVNPALTMWLYQNTFQTHFALKHFSAGNAFSSSYVIEFELFSIWIVDQCINPAVYSMCILWCVPQSSDARLPSRKLKISQLSCGISRRQAPFCLHLLEI
jgi:hypothetical protein